MNIQTAIDELTSKDQNAIAQDEKYANAGEELTADHWCGMSVAYTGSIQLLEVVRRTDNPDISGVITEITNRGESAKHRGDTQDEPSSRAHDQGIAAGSRDVVAHLKSAAYPSSH